MSDPFTSDDWSVIAHKINQYLARHVHDLAHSVTLHLCRLKDLHLPLMLRMPTGSQLGLLFPGPLPQGAEQEREEPPAVPLAPQELPPPPRRAWHADDWSVVEYGYRRYELTLKQRQIVQLLWEKAEESPEHPEVRESDLLNAVDSDSDRVRDLFKRLPGWQALLVRVGSDAYRLAELPPLAEAE